MTKTAQFSPRYLRVSLAAAMTLGFKPGIFYRGARLHCLNLLLTYRESCQANCSYCGLRRANEVSEVEKPSFIRVEWPTYLVADIVERTLKQKNLIERICVSMIMHPHAFADTTWLVGELGRVTHLPVSVLANPTTMKEGMMDELYKSGADMVSVAIDAATADLFDIHRGGGVNGPHTWDNYWNSLGEAVKIFGKNKVGCHLIAGLGETESQMVDTIQRVRDLGGRTHLFSFYPEPGSRLQSASPCPLGQFRRIQLARFLIDYDLVKSSGMRFDKQGRITGFGLSGAALDNLIDSGKPFLTSGCPGKSLECACNRPYGDGPPSDIRSYPFEPDQSDIKSFRKELATYDDL